MEDEELAVQKIIRNIMFLIGMGLGWYFHSRGMIKTFYGILILEFLSAIIGITIRLVQKKREKKIVDDGKDHLIAEEEKVVTPTKEEHNTYKDKKQVKQEEKK